MATISKYRKKNGELSYQATVRVKQGGKVIFSATRSFPKESLARDWARRTEVEAASPDFISQHALGKLTIAELLTRYRHELTETGALGRSKSYVLDLLLRSSLAELRVAALSAGEVVAHCQARRAGGTGPATVFQDVSALRTVLDYAKRIWGLPVSTAAVDEALPTLRSQTLVSKSRKRDRRPSADEMQRILEWLTRRQARSNAQIPHVDIVRFAIASCMRLGEIGRILWADVDEVRRCVLIRERKDPSNQYTNDQWVPLLGEAWEVVQRQPRMDERIFPYNMDSVGAAFERACRALGIEDLRFHDLRHHGVSQLFEQGLGIQEVAMVSGHKSWNNLKRYTQLKPESLHDKIAAPTAPALPSPLVATVAGCLYMGRWSNVADIASAYELDHSDLEGLAVLFAADFSNQGACVLFTDADKMFLVTNSAASRDWQPEVMSVNRIKHKVATGRIGRDHQGNNLFGSQLAEVLSQR